MWAKLKNFFSSATSNSPSNDPKSQVKTPATNDKTEDPKRPLTPQQQQQPCSTCSSAISASSPVKINLAQMRRRSANRPLSSTMPSPIFMAQNDDPQDSFHQLNLLNDQLGLMDIQTFTNLRSMLECKFGRGSHLARDEMAALRSLSGDISSEYKKFCDIIYECVQLKLSSNSPVSPHMRPQSPGFSVGEDLMQRGPSSIHSFPSPPPIKFEGPLYLQKDRDKKNEAFTDILPSANDSAFASLEGSDKGASKEKMFTEPYCATPAISSPIEDAKDGDLYWATPAVSSPIYEVIQSEVHCATPAVSTPVHEAKDMEHYFAMATPNVLPALSEDADGNENYNATPAVSAITDETNEAILVTAPSTNEISMGYNVEFSENIAVELKDEKGMLSPGSEEQSENSSKNPTPVLTDISHMEVTRHRSAKPGILNEDQEKIMSSYIVRAELLFKSISSLVEDVKKLVESHRSVSQVPVMSPNSEMANLQRFYVRQKYKEMVKGCGSGRTIYGIAWAGTYEPGDAWMNNLLKCYWREIESRKFEWTMLARPLTKSECADENAEGPDFLDDPIGFFSMQNESDLELRRRMDLLSMKATYGNVHDAIDVDDLIFWLKSIRKFPRLHSPHTLEVVETAVEKMGGWELCDVFLRNWLKQFYMEFGRSNISFPLPGCKSWAPETDVAIDGSIKSLPSTLALSDIQERGKQYFSSSGKFKSSASKNSTEPFLDILKNMIRTPSNQDNRHWDLVCKSICKDLMALHSMFEAEFESNYEAKINEWMRMVQESGLLETGEYKDYGISASVPFDKSFTETQLKLLHPSLVKIREKAIVLNALCDPKRYRRLFQIDDEIRDIFGNSKISKSGSLQRLSFFRSLSISTTSVNKVFHRKSRSFDVSGLIFGSSKNSTTTGDESPKLKQLEAQSNLKTKLSGPEMTQEIPQTPPIAKLHEQSSVPLTTLPRTTNIRTVSAPSTSADSYGETVAIFAEVREICTAILSKKKLLSPDFIQSAFEVSEIVVKHYLTEELPAKYHAVY